MPSWVWQRSLLAFTVFASRRWALALILVYDAFHFGIFLLAGANYFNWIFVNLCIIAVIATLPARW